MNIETIAKQPSNHNQVNWTSAFFMAAFHIGAIAALFFFTWKALFVAAFFVVGVGKLGDRNGLSPPAHAPGVQDSEMGGILSDGMRNFDVRGRSDFLGRHA